MFTQPPEITIDATIGQIIVQPTASPVATSTSSSESSSAPATSQATATSIPSRSPAPLYTFPPVPTEPPQRLFSKSALSIFGYGPALTNITLKGFGVSEKTVSGENGFFRFSSVYSLTSLYPELCIQGFDSESRVTQPTCIPAFPFAGIIPLEVGPVLLSPTISFGPDYLSGKTTPNTKIKIHIFKKDNYRLPSIDITSNEKGGFDINTPSFDSAEYMIFASTHFGDNPSAKSNTLKLSVASFSKAFIEDSWNTLIKNKITAFVIAEVIVFVILFIGALKSITKTHKIHSEREYLEEIKDIT